jgi:hypothetical protein
MNDELRDAYHAYLADPRKDILLLMGMKKDPINAVLDAVKNCVADANEFTAGDMAIPLYESQLHCGSGVYDCAICVSSNPFVLVSTSGDMMWSKHHPADFKNAGRTSSDQTRYAMARWARESKPAKAAT